jgi:hypothetical protein
MTVRMQSHWTVDQTKVAKKNSLRVEAQASRKLLSTMQQVVKRREDAALCFEAACMYEAHGNHEKASIFFDHAAGHERIATVLERQVIGRS